jgi:group I intron endonuclease
MGIVYLIINKQNGKKYVDATTKMMNKSWAEHLNQARRMSREPLHRAIRDYGAHLFQLRELDECTKDLLSERQQYWIDQYKPEYNTELPEEVKEQPKQKGFRVPQQTQKPKGFALSKHRGTGKSTGIRIQSMNLDTGEIKEWENSRTAAAEIAGDPNRGSNILLSAKKGYIAYNHRWKLLENKTLKRPVKAVNKITWQEYYFESIADAIRQVSPHCHNTSSMKKALESNGRYTYKGFMWFYM